MSSHDHLHIPGYEILEQIGKGGQGLVFRARQISLDRIVAIKVITLQGTADRKANAAFLKEARLASQLHHPNILQAIDVGCHEGLWFFVMEYVSGPNAHALVREKGRLKPLDVLHIGYQIGEALQCGFERGIVHGDIKPENIIIAHDGTVKVVDFGIARYTRETGRTIRGTPVFMAPEVVAGKTLGDVRSDLFSLGLTLYNLLTGSLPSRKKSRRDQAHGIRHEVDRRLQPILTKLLAPDPAARYQVPTELLRALGKVPGFTPRPAITAARMSLTRFLPALGVTAVFILILVVAIVLVKIAGTKTPRPSKTKPTTSSTLKQDDNASMPVARKKVQPTTEQGPALLFEPSTHEVREGALMVVTLRALDLSVELDPSLRVLDAEGRDVSESTEKLEIRRIPGSSDLVRIRWRAPWFVGHETVVRTIVASQGRLQGSVEVRIRDRNRSPDLDLKPPRKLLGDGPYTLRFRVTDPDGDVVRLSIKSRMPGLDARFQGDDLKVDGEAGKYLLVVVAEDGHGGRQTMDLTLDLSGRSATASSGALPSEAHQKELLNGDWTALDTHLIYGFLQYAEACARSRSDPDLVPVSFWRWLDVSPEIRKGLLVGLHPHYNPKVLTCLQRLRARFGKQVAAFRHLALAFAFAWSAGDGADPKRYREEETWIRGRSPVPSMEDSFGHYIRNAERMKAPLKKIPWPLLAAVSMNSVPIEEREWILQRYSEVPVEDLGARFAALPGVDSQLRTLPLTVPNLANHGCGFTVKTQHALCVARSLGLPAFYSRSGDHCWPCWIVRTGNAYRVHRVGDRGNPCGMVPDPIGGRQLKEADFALLASAVEHSYDGYLAAELAANVYEMFLSKREDKLDGVVPILEEAIERNPYSSRCWLHLADASARGLLGSDRTRRLHETCTRTLNAHVDLMCDVLRRMGSKNESPEFLRSLEGGYSGCLKAGRPALAAQMAVLRSRVLASTGNRQAAVIVIRSAGSQLTKIAASGDAAAFEPAYRIIAEEAIQLRTRKRDRRAFLFQMVEASRGGQDKVTAAHQRAVEGIAAALAEAGEKKLADQWTVGMLVSKRLRPPMSSGERGRLKTDLRGAKDHGVPFEDLGPGGGVLCGFRFTLSHAEWGSPDVQGFLSRGPPVIGSLQPLYRTPEGVVSGTQVGKVDGPVHEVKARIAYGVAGMVVAGEIVIEGFSPVFMRIKDRTFDTADYYVGDWHGGRTGKRTDLLGLTGVPIVGILGRSGRNLDALGLIGLSPDDTHSRLGAADHDPRHPVPSPVQQARETARVGEKYSRLYEDKSREGCVQRARTLLWDAKRKTPGEVVHYVLLRETQAAAQKAGNAELAFNATGHLRSHYRLEPVALEVEVLKNIAKQLRSAKDRLLFCCRYMAAFDLALNKHDYEAARSLVAKAEMVAREARWPPVGDEMKACAPRLAQHKRMYADANEAQRKLEADPSDQPARHVVARYYILIQKDWARAAEVLGPGTESELKNLVVRDQATPITSIGCFELGQALASYAKGLRDDPLLTAACFERAFHWYSKVSPDKKDRVLRTKLKAAMVEASLQFGPTRRYLVDVAEEVADVGQGRFGKGDDAGHENARISVARKRFFRCLSTHPPVGGSARVTYRVEKKWRTFSTCVAVNDTAGRGSRTPLVFKVYGDGRLLWESKLVQRTGAIQTCEVSILGVKELELKVECRRDNSAAHAIWIDPFLAK